MSRNAVLAALVLVAFVSNGALATSTSCAAGETPVGGDTDESVEAGSYHVRPSGDSVTLFRETNGVPGLQQSDRQCWTTTSGYTLYEADEKIGTYGPPSIPDSPPCVWFGGSPWCVI